MLGFHTFFPNPYKDKYVYVDEYAYLTWLVSILNWKKFNGSMVCFTNDRGLKFLKNVNLYHFYDEVILELNNYQATKYFWSGCKIFSASQIKEPSVSIDYDLIIWNKIPEEKYNSEITCLHKEQPNYSLYTDHVEYFKKLLEFAGHPEYENWQSLPLNVGFLFIKDYEVKQLYWRITQNLDKLSEQLKGKANTSRTKGAFLEQRVLGMLCDFYGWSTDSILNDFVFSKNDHHIPLNKTITHLWGSKEHYRKNRWAAFTYCDYLLKYITDNYKVDTQTLQSIISNINDKKQQLIKDEENLKTCSQLPVFDMNIVGLYRIKTFIKDKICGGEIY